MNRLPDKSDRDLTIEETLTEKDKVTVFYGSNGNTVFNMLNFISENYEGYGRTYIDKHRDEIFSSYGLSLIEHKSSGFDS